ncbi:hypothetical protein ACSBR1_010219 [Camellia fascicularis]
MCVCNLPFFCICRRHKNNQSALCSSLSAVLPAVHLLSPAGNLSGALRVCAI